MLTEEGVEDVPVTAAILRTAQSSPERLAIVGEDARLTYAELLADSCRVFAAVDALHNRQKHPPAPAAETQGIPITAVSLESAFHTSRIIAGLSGYRAVSATIDPRWPLEHRVRVILATGVGVVISDAGDLAEALERERWGGTVIGSAAFQAHETGVTPWSEPSVRGGHEPFLLLFSSGTTSNPKAFLKTRDQYRENLAISTAHLEPHPGVATLAPGPVSYSLTLYALIECLATGGSVHMADAFDPVSSGHRVKEETITRVVAVPAIVQALAAAARRDPERFASLGVIVTGGANLPAAVREGVAATLSQTHLISYYGAAEIGFIGDSRGGDGTRISVYDGVEVEIRDERGASVQDGELGTLWARTPASSDGYLAGTTDACLRGVDGWATVHDQGRIAGGRLELVGRAGDIAVTGGHKVGLPEVERAFDGVDGIDAVCAVALPHARLGSVIALVVEGDAPHRDALLAVAKERLAPQFVPGRWYRIPALPRTVGGKIQRGATTELIAAGEGERL